MDWLVTICAMIPKNKFVQRATGEKNDRPSPYLENKPCINNVMCMTKKELGSGLCMDILEARGTMNEENNPNPSYSSYTTCTPLIILSIIWLSFKVIP